MSRNALDAHWALDPEIVFLNHGSFGACPRSVLAYQSQLRAQLEMEPVRFFVRELEPLLDRVRQELGAFLGASPRDLVFVPNATTGINAVLRSLPIREGDELLVTDHIYNACWNAVNVVAERCGARVEAVAIPFPLRSSEEVVDCILERLTPRTRWALVDHVTSPTGLVLSIERIASELHRRDIEVIVDGAHAPGMVPLDLEALGVAYYTGNCHKWVCAPKGAAFLFVRRDRHDGLRPLVISHGANATRTDRSRLHLEFDWTGTGDPTPFLCIGEALRRVGGLKPGGWDEIRTGNRALALTARTLLCERLSIEEPAPGDMIGSLATVPLPPSTAPLSDYGTDTLGDALFARHRIEVPILNWPHWPTRHLRISAAPYNQLSEYETLADALAVLLPE